MINLLLAGIDFSAWGWGDLVGGYVQEFVPSPGSDGRFLIAS
jgi:hypothetical protein